MPDLSAAVTDPDVTPQFDGGYNVAAFTDEYGTVQFYGGTTRSADGQAGSMNAKALAVSFCAGDQLHPKDGMSS